MLLFLHGAAERGSNVEDVARQGLPKYLSGFGELSEAERRTGKDLVPRFIVIAPQCRQYEVWDEDALLALLEQVSEAYPVDPSRVYLTGLSMGGFGVWSFGLRHPERFAAIVPICGGGRVADVTGAPVARRNALRDLAIWAFHGAKDRVVPPDESVRMIEALHGAGFKSAQLTVYPEAEHDSWTLTYTNPGLYDWLLQQSRQDGT